MHKNKFNFVNNIMQKEILKNLLWKADYIMVVINYLSIKYC